MSLQFSDSADPLPSNPTFFLDIVELLLLLLLLHVFIEIASHINAWFRINSRRRTKRFGMESTAVDFKHCVSFFILTIPYHWHALKGMFWCTVRYLFPSMRQTIQPSCAIRYLLECSLVTFVRHAPDLGPNMFRFRIDNILSPIFIGKTDVSCVVEFDIRTYEITRFEYNDLVIEDHVEQLSLLIHTAATATHPAVHKHQDHHYSYRHRAGAAYNNLFLHGPLLNEYAYFYAGILFRHGISWFATVLKENSERAQPTPHDMETFRRLMPYSRYVRFALGARTLLFQLVRIHGVNVNPEIFFINSVIHSLDHYVPSFVDNIYLEHKVTSQKPLYNLVRSFFYYAIGRYERFGTNFLVDNKDRNPFYRDLYKGFSKLDQELADSVMLSIAC